MSAVVAALAMALPGGAGAQALDTSHSLGASSAWLVRGVSLSRGDMPAVFASVNAYASSGWSLGGLLGHFESETGEATTAVNLRAGYEWTLDSRWTLMAQLRHLSYPGTEALRLWCYNEAGASLADADRWVLSWSAETRRGPGCNDHQGPAIVSRSVEINTHWPLDSGFSLGGGLGRRMYGGGEGYLYGQAGGAWRQSGWRLQLDRVWVSPQAQQLYGGVAHHRWVGSVIWAF